jgi:glycosyltransferase involved in cell wall biosynthesis
VARGSFDLLAAIAELRRREERGRARRQTAFDATKSEPLQYAPAVTEGPLRIAYPVNRVDACGGTRIIIEHANRLSRLGHQVTLVGHSARPEWIHLECAYRQVPYEVELMHGLGLCDLIVATYWDQLIEARLSGRARVLYLEQGDYHLYDEISAEQQACVASQLRAADAVIAVSKSASVALRERYGIETVAVVSNGIDRSQFRPGLRELGKRPYMLVVGAQHNAFKRLDDAFAAWELLKAAGHDLELVWVTPTVPYVPTGHVVVAPSQAELVQWYRNASVFVSASEYESFSLPPLEAMACGTPAVVASNDGVLLYAQDGSNALVVPARSPLELASAVESILQDDELRSRLIQGGLLTADSYDWERSVTLLDAVVRQQSGARVEMPSPEWTLTVTPADFVDRDGFERLSAALRDAPEATIEVPLIGEAFHRHHVGSWLTVAQRPTGSGTLRLWCPIRRLDLRWSEGVELFRDGWVQHAHDWFLKRYAEATEVEDQVCFIRWLVLSAIESRADELAIDWLRRGLELSPSNADLWYLAGLVQVLAGQTESGAAIARALGDLGDAAGHSEFFFNVADLARSQLTPAAPSGVAGPSLTDPASPDVPTSDGHLLDGAC